ncbi:hypothetical protein KI688_011385 [Linnemannia hyalina]|uniref:Uncharacterized protein n=1 Tax=Linnemannia hyalina TaxID=64524 RepID=A0A9P7XX33_9FUNG|nr:hypothetical protein KI688_011385 [Linnemannia hyalina]
MRQQEQELMDLIQVFEQQVPLRVQEFKKQCRQDQHKFAQPHQLQQKQYQLLQQQIQQVHLQQQQELLRWALFWEYRKLVNKDETMRLSVPGLDDGDEDDD